MITRKLVFKPHFYRFLFKRNFIAFFLTVFFFGGTILIAYIENKEIDLLFWYVTAVIFPIVFIGWFSFNFLYIRLIIYELDKNEIVTRKGLIQKKVVTVPFRAITNITIIRDPIDRILKIGSLKIETAGHSGEETPEIVIQGITNFDQIYDKLMYRAKIIGKLDLDVLDLPLDERTQLNLQEIRKAILQEFIEIRDLLRNRR